MIIYNNNLMIHGGCNQKLEYLSTSIIINIDNLINKKLFEFKIIDLNIGCLFGTTLHCYSNKFVIYILYLFKYIYFLIYKY